MKTWDVRTVARIFWRGKWVFAIATVLGLAATVVTARPLIHFRPAPVTVAYLSILFGTPPAELETTVLRDPDTLDVVQISAHVLRIRSRASEARLSEILEPLLQNQAELSRKVHANYEAKISWYEEKAKDLLNQLTGETDAHRRAAMYGQAVWHQLVALRIRSEMEGLSPSHMLRIEQARQPRAERLPTTIVSSLAALYVAAMLAFAFGYAIDLRRKMVTPTGAAGNE
jgi:hypothetical protein